MLGTALRFMVLLPALLLGGCTRPPAMSWKDIEAHAELSNASAHVALGVLVERNGTNLVGNQVTLVVLDDGRALTADHCTAEWIPFFSTPSDDGSQPFDMIVHRDGRPVRILARGNGADPLHDWVLLSVPWSSMDSKRPVVQKTTPIVGEPVFLIGYPGRYTGMDWTQQLFGEADLLHPQHFQPPSPVVLRGVVSDSNDDRYGIVVKMPGQGRFNIQGISGGPGFVVRDGQLAIIGIIARNGSTPFRRDVTLTPIDNIPVAIPEWTHP